MKELQLFWQLNVLGVFPAYTHSRIPFTLTSTDCLTLCAQLDQIMTMFVADTFIYIVYRPTIMSVCLSVCLSVCIPTGVVYLRHKILIHDHRDTLHAYIVYVASNHRLSDAKWS